VPADSEIAALRSRLIELDRERQKLQKRPTELTPPPATGTTPRGSEQTTGETPQVLTTSPVAAKVALFRRLFAGRTDVYPVRWENIPAQKSGYAPACANEWRRGICAKPRIKCTECPNQAFLPVSDDTIENHSPATSPQRRPPRTATTHCS
jgi:hypothetical protein